jgi:hypothetical protein
VLTQAGTVLATIPRVRSSANDVAVSLAATPGGWVLTARDGRLITTGECGCDYFVSRGELVVRGGYDGSLATLVKCFPKAGFDEQPPLQVVAGASGYLLSGVRCGAPGMVDTIAADGTIAPIAGIEPSLYGGLSYAEPFAAIQGTATGAPKLTSLHVYDTAGGTRRDVPSGNDWDGSLFQVLADGTVLLGRRGAGNVREGIFSWPLGAAAPALLPGPGKAPLGVAGGGRLLFIPAAPVADLALIGLDGSGSRSVGAPGAGAARTPLYLDATTAAFMSKSCTGHAQVTTVDLTDATPATGIDGCPVQFQDSTVKFDRKGRGTLRVICPNGCRSQMQLYISLKPKQISTHEENQYIDKVFDTRLANAKLNLPASPTAGSVAVTLVKPAISLLRKHHYTLRVFPSTGFSSDIGSGPEIVGAVPTLTVRLRR